MIRATCPRCKRPVRDRGVTVQGELFGPTCAAVVSRRRRVRASFGEGPQLSYECHVTHRIYYAKTESEKICPDVSCAYCRYNTKPYIAVNLCPLEEAAYEKELHDWRQSK